MTVVSSLHLLCFIVGILVASVVERVGTKEKGEEGEEGRGGREGVREDSSFYVLFRFVS